MDQESTHSAQRRLMEALDQIADLYNLYLPDLPPEDLSESSAAQAFDFKPDEATVCLYAGLVYEMHVHIGVGLHGVAVAVCGPAIHAAPLASAVALAEDTRSACAIASQCETMLRDMIGDMTHEELAAALHAQYTQGIESQDAVDKPN